MRTVIAFFWFCVLIIEAAYTANLAAFLTLQQIDERVKSLYDLAGQTKITYGVENGSEIMAFFKVLRNFFVYFPLIYLFIYLHNRLSRYPTRYSLDTIYRHVDEKLNIGPRDRQKTEGVVEEEGGGRGEDEEDDNEEEEEEDKMKEGRGRGEVAGRGKEEE